MIKLNKSLFPLVLIFLLIFYSCSIEDKPANSESATFQVSEVTEVTESTAVVLSKITDSGGAEIVERGVTWNVDSEPTVADNKTEDGGGKGSFTSELKDLEPNTTYYVRPYSRSDGGTSYGDEVEFKTLEEVALYNGVVLKTSNGGKEWTSIPISNVRYLHDLYFLNENIGYAVGELGRIMKTVDGGHNWTMQNSGIYILYDIFFLDEKTGYAVGNGSTILKTMDGGENWIPQESTVPQELKSVHFTDENTGYIVGSQGRVLKTTNAGEEWEVIADSHRNGLNDVAFVDSSTGFAIGYERIYKTIDGGEVWTTERTTPVEMHEMHIFADGPLYGVGHHGHIYKAANASSDWEELAQNLNYGLRTIFFTDSLTGYVGGMDGDIFKTIDGGESWLKQESGAQYFIESIYFPTPNTGFAVGRLQ